MNKGALATSILKKTWTRLRRKDARLWSLRQVAKEANISPGYLSKVFAKKKALQPRHAKKLVTILKVDGIDKEAVLASFGLPHLQSELKLKTMPRLEAFELAPEQSEWLLGKWYRLPLLDLMTTADFKSDPEWMAKRLGVSVSDICDSLKKLVGEGLAKVDEQGTYRKVHKKIRFPAVISKTVIREYHKNQMRRAMSELEQRVTPRAFNKRLIVGLSVATNPQKIEEAKNFLHLALYKAAEILAEGECTEVYQLNVQAFSQTGER